MVGGEIAFAGPIRLPDVGDCTIFDIRRQCNFVRSYTSCHRRNRAIIWNLGFVVWIFHEVVVVRLALPDSLGGGTKIKRPVGFALTSLFV